jgi:heme exporter protein C
VLGIIGIVQIPLVHFSVTWWRTLHQAPSLIRPDGPQIQDSLMLVALVVGVVAFTAIYGALMVKRVELQGLEEQLIAGEQGADRPVAGDAVTAPDLALGGEA